MIGWTKYYIYLLRRRIRGAHTNVVLALEHMGLGALIISLYDLNGGTITTSILRRKLTLATELVNTVALMIGNSIYGVRLS
jgi:hypothetical protein